MPEFYQTVTPATIENAEHTPLPEKQSRNCLPCPASPNVDSPELARIVSCWHCKTSIIVDLLMHATGASGVNMDDNPHLSLKAQVETFSTSLMVALDDLGDIGTVSAGCNAVSDCTPFGHDRGGVTNFPIAPP